MDHISLKYQDSRNLWESFLLGKYIRDLGELQGLGSNCLEFLIISTPNYWHKFKYAKWGFLRCFLLEYETFWEWKLSAPEIKYQFPCFCPTAIYDSITWLGQSEITSHRPIYTDPEIGTQESVSEIFEHHTYSPQKTQRYGYEFIVYLCLLVKIDGLHICISERLSEPSVNLFIQPAQNKESFSAKLVALHFTPVSRSVEGWHVVSN